MERYYKDPELTNEVLKDGWFYTGDLARVDQKGLYYIVGRKQDMIKVSRQIVFPAEVEEAIHKNAEVKEAAVIGIPDPLRGEMVKAFVVLKDRASVSEQDLKQFCRQHLAHFKLPHAVVFVESLPKNRAGKIDKVALKQQ